MKQKKDDDIWLLNVGGMVPNKEEYASFLKTATYGELYIFSGANCGPNTGAHWFIGPVIRADGADGPVFLF